jgi:hypothetical protein
VREREEEKTEFLLK